MTTPIQTSIVELLGNGVSLSFPFPYYVQDATHLKVYLGGILQVSGYTVTGLGNPAGGTVNFTVAPGSAVKVLLRRAVPLSQLVDYVPYDGFPAEVAEQGLDKLTQALQDLKTLIEGTIHVVESELPGSPLLLPSIAARAEKLLGFNALGESTVYNMNLTVYGVLRHYEVAIAGQTVFNLSYSYSRGVNAMAVYVNGIRQRIAADFTESSVTQVTMTYGLLAGDEVEFIAGQEQGAAVGDAGAITYTSGGAGAVTTNVRDRLRQMVSVKDFGAVGDGVTDDRVAITAAALACEASGKTLWFPAGTYPYSNTGVHAIIRALTGPLRIVGDGVDKTFLKNLTATAGMVRFDYFGSELRDLTLNANSATYEAFLIFGYGCIVENVRIKNQAGSLVPALLADGATQLNLNNLQISACATGLELGRTLETLYPFLDRVVIGKCTSGPALKMKNVVAGSFYSVYFEPSIVAALNFDSCEDNHFHDLEAELDVTTALGTASYVLVNNCDNLHFHSGRLNHTGTIDKKVFQLTGTNLGVTWDNFFVGTTKTGMTLFSTEGTDRHLSWRNIRGYGVAAFTGVNNATQVDTMIVDGWDTGGSGPCTHVFNAKRAKISNVNDNFSIVTGAVGGLLVNCNGTVTGAAATSIERIGQNGSRTWTPVISFGGSSAGVTYSAQIGSYSVVGGRCYFDCKIALTNNGSGVGQASISLPLPMSARSGYAAIFQLAVDSAAVGVTQPLTAVAVVSGTIADLYYLNAGSFGALTETQINNSTVVYVSGSYEI